MWAAFLIQGIILLVLGVLAVAEPVMASIAIGIFVGWLFIASGIVGLVAAFSSSGTGRSLWGIIASALALLVGVLLVWHPIPGVLSLTLLLVVLFIVEGVAQIVLGLEHRRLALVSWGWMLASGIADLLLAAIIISGWPGTAAWALGLIVGVNLITTGVALIMGSLALRRMA
ncbi:MAG TPA: DUF308 domain-containing protein [Stellaceae bacterium]|nr:DUF308 domain-containing protein [Stellaceae bacterium]